jgi:hypothetical protein
MRLAAGASLRLSSSEMASARLPKGLHPRLEGVGGGFEPGFGGFADRNAPGRAAWGAFWDAGVWAKAEERGSERQGGGQAEQRGSWELPVDDPRKLRPRPPRLK